MAEERTERLELAEDYANVLRLELAYVEREVSELVTLRRYRNYLNLHGQKRLAELDTDYDEDRIANMAGDIAEDRRRPKNLDELEWTKLRYETIEVLEECKE